MWLLATRSKCGPGFDLDECVFGAVRAGASGFLPFGDYYGE
jgi:hypothetical protein